MTTQMTEQQIFDVIMVMDENELVQLNNLYCQSTNCFDNEIYGNDDDFMETFFGRGTAPMRLAQAIYYGDYHYYHEFVRFNGYGNLETFQNMTTDQLCELVPTMAEYIAENFYEFEYLFPNYEN
jgi:hypothetical protein